MTHCPRCGKTGLQPDSIHTCTPLALKLADRLDSSDPDFDDCTDAAAELRRLHAENEQLRQQLAGRGEPVAVVVDAYDTPGLQWLCQHPPERGDRLYTAPQPQPKQEPEGWKLVPVEPTPEMKTAGIAVEVYPESKPEIGALTWAEVKAIYSAMLAAAPQPAGEPVASAVQTVIEAMQADPDYAWGWHCSIAMAFVDAGGSHYTANQGAARFMRVLANVEPAHELPAAPQPHPDDTALLTQALEFMNELLPATSEISAEHLSDPTLLRDLELRDAIMERLK